MRHTWKQINNQTGEKLGHREHMGSKNTTKKSRGVTLLPPNGRCVLAPWNNRGGETGGNQGGGSGGGRTPGRGPADRDQGGDGGRSQGRDRRDPEQEEQSMTQATAMMVAHSGGMAADSRGPTNGGGAGGVGARGGYGEPQSKGDGEDPEVLGGDAEALIWEAAVEPERQSPEEEPRG